MEFGSGIDDDSDHSRRSAPGEFSGTAGERESAWLGVHVLSEFIFCPRAGLLAYERRKLDTGDEEPCAPRLDYVPDYEAEVIREKLDDVGRRLRAAGSFAGLLLVAMFVASFFDLATALLIGAGSLPGLPWLSRQIRLYLFLYGEWRQALGGKTREPDPNLTVVQQVNWWDLLQAGFESVEPREGLRDPGLQITGRPFRLLRRGAVCIPVFRTSQTDRKLHRQHYARLAAYAHLITTCEGARTPYGIMLYGESYEADAVPITPASRTAFEQGLEAARDVLSESRSQRSSPGRPSLESVCRGCHLGRPRLYRPGESELTLGESVVKPFLTTDSENDNEYHSDCGDRYRWVPPHKLAIVKGLTD